jgi:hypothetical protein
MTTSTYSALLSTNYTNKRQWAEPQGRKMQRIGNALHEIINETLEENGVELTSWMIADVVTKIELYLNYEHGLVDAKEGSRNIWGEVVTYE